MVGRIMKAVNYNEVAVDYDKRFKAYKQDGIALKLQELAREIDAETILEVGCGTGHWLEVLQDFAQVFGIDRSPGMLKKAVERCGNYFLINGDIDYLPFKGNTFNMVFCVNALHHFLNPSGLIFQVRRLLKQDGALAIVNMDPHVRQDHWFIYEYFPGTYETDLKRYPSFAAIKDWMISAGFKDIQSRIGERVIHNRYGRDVLALSQNDTSQLTLLSKEAYQEGISRIKKALREAEEAGEILIFQVDISLVMITGRV